MAPPEPPKITVNLVQKPTKKAKMEIESTIRDMKRKGYEILSTQREKTNEELQGLKEITDKI